MLNLPDVAGDGGISVLDQVEHLRRKRVLSVRQAVEEEGQLLVFWVVHKDIVAGVDVPGCGGSGQVAGELFNGRPVLDDVRLELRDGVQGDRGNVVEGDVGDGEREGLLAFCCRDVGEPEASLVFGQVLRQLEGSEVGVLCGELGVGRPDQLLRVGIIDVGEAVGVGSEEGVDDRTLCRGQQRK